MRFLVLIVSFGYLFVGSCKPNSDAPCREAYIDPIGFTYQELLKLPYAGINDTLGYVNQNGDSLMFIGLDKLSWYKTFPIKNNPECADDSVGFIINQFNYRDSLNNLMIVVTAYKYDSLVNISINNALFSIPFVQIGVSDSVNYFDSIPFESKMFYGVKSFVNSNGDSLYYNTSFGIVAFKKGTQKLYLYRFNKK